MVLYTVYIIWCSGAMCPHPQDKVRSQDSVFVIAGTTGSAVGRDLAWKFFRDNFDKLNERYCGGFLLSRLVQVCVCVCVWVLLE